MNALSATYPLMVSVIAVLTLTPLLATAQPPAPASAVVYSTKHPGPCKKTYDRGSDGTPESFQKFEYAEKRLVKTTLHSGKPIELTSTTQYEYDAQGRMVKSSTSKAGESSGSSGTTYDYDDDGKLIRRQEVTYQLFGSSITSIYKYDARGQLVESLVQLSADTSHKTTYTYKKGKLVRAESLSLDLVNTYSYDKADRLIKVYVKDLRQPDSVTTYTYDNEGNLAKAEKRQLPKDDATEDDARKSKRTWTYDYSCWRAKE